MEDFEIRQVFSIIRDRVNEIKKDQDWKENIAKEWNQAAEADQDQDIQVGQAEPQNQEYKPQERSVYSYSKYNFMCFIPK